MVTPQRLVDPEEPYGFKECSAAAYAHDLGCQDHISIPGWRDWFHMLPIHNPNYDSSAA